MLPWNVCIIIVLELAIKGKRVASASYGPIKVVTNHLPYCILALGMANVTDCACEKILSLLRWKKTRVGKSKESRKSATREIGRSVELTKTSTYHESEDQQPAVSMDKDEPANADGKLRFGVSPQKAPLPLHRVEECLKNYISDEGKATAIMEYMKDTREAKENSATKRSYEDQHPAVPVKLN